MAMIAVALLVSQMRIPNGENVSVGLCLAEEPMAEAIAAGLSQRESVFEFIVFEKESELRKALETAEIDSGFLFSEEFEEKVKKGCSKELITFLRTPFSAKGTVAKETLYAVFLEKYGEEILLDGRKEIYEEDRKDLVPFLLERNAEYLKSEEFFRTEVEAIPVQETSDKEELTDIYPIQGIMGIFLFVLLWMTFGRRFEGNGRGICLALDRKRQKRFEYLGYLAAVTIPSVTGIGCRREQRSGDRIVSHVSACIYRCTVGVNCRRMVQEQYGTFCLGARLCCDTIGALSGIDQYLRLLACCRLYKIFISARVVCLKELHCKIHFSVFLFLVIPGGNRYNEKESLEGGDGKRCFN